MKSIALFALSILVTTGAFASTGEELFPRKQFKIVSPDQSFSLDDLKVQVQLRCRFGGANGFNPDPAKSCGNKSWDVSLSPDGVFEIPRLNKFSGLFHARFASNYFLHIALYKESGESVALVKADRLEGFKMLVRLKSELHVVSFPEKNLDIVYGGRSFFQSPEVSDPQSTLQGAVLSQYMNRKGDIAVLTKWSVFAAFRSYGNSRGYQTKLGDQNTFVIPAFTYAYFPAIGASINLEITFEKNHQVVDQSLFMIDVKDYPSLKTLTLKKGKN